jgi:hypothetical protein
MSDERQQGRRVNQAVNLDLLPDFPPKADMTLGQARALLPGWDIWYVSGVTSTSCTWSAKPSGAIAAVQGCSGLLELRALVKAVRKYESGLDAHIAGTRKELEETPEDMFPRRNMLEARISALLALQQMKQSA